MVVLLALSVMAVGSCTIADCLKVKVGWGLIIGMYAVVSFVVVVALKCHWKTMFKEGFRFKDLQVARWVGGLIGSVLPGSLFVVVAGVLSVSSIISLMVGGIVAWTVIPILLISVIVLVCICLQKRR